jgi:hypothetical protein
MLIRLKVLPVRCTKQGGYTEALAYRLLRMVSRKEAWATKSDQGEGYTGADGTRIQAVHCQRLFGSRYGSQYFEVQPPSQDQDSLSTVPIDSTA